MRPLWSNKLKSDSSEKTTWCQSACQAHEPIVDAAVDGLPVGESCIKAPLHAIRGAADVDELTKPTLVHL
ncbi:hypothetical protein TNCV_4363581 [Trichonephila clavipes]|nr:hypothetical protein TNCV_4363581 [Trichonephila clavipes]